jgi:hypothetical protein
MRTRSGVKRWGKTLEHLLLGVDPDVSERVPDVERISVLERYRQGDLAIHLHMRVRTRASQANAENLCALVVRSSPNVMDVSGIDMSDILDVAEPKQRPVWADRLHRLSHEKGWLQEVMLVRTVEAIELPQGMTPDHVDRLTQRILESTVVWLDALNNCPVFRARSLQGVFGSLRVPFAFLVEDWECRATLPSSRCASTQDDELPDQFVQQRPQVMGELANEDSPFPARRISRYAKDVLARLTIELTDETAIYLLEKGGDFLIEEGQVLISAFETQEATV